MKAVKTPRVKVCCISSLEEARLAIECGASALGLVAEMPSGPGVIKETLIREITSQIPPSVASFLLTSEQEPEAIITQQKRCRANTLQFVDAIPFEAYVQMREAMPGISFVQVIHICDEGSIQEAHSVASYVDAILLDSGNPKLAIKELGGTGRRHDWKISRQIREQVDVPVFLAGGLNPENVREAIEWVGPFGLDICSGVRTDGRLDEGKLRRFFELVGA